MIGLALPTFITLFLSQNASRTLRNEFKGLCSYCHMADQARWMYSYVMLAIADWSRTPTLFDVTVENGHDKSTSGNRRCPKQKSRVSSSTEPASGSSASFTYARLLEEGIFYSNTADWRSENEQIEQDESDSSHTGNVAEEEEDAEDHPNLRMQWRLTELQT